ncbi:hypothetical protein V1638_00770 [Pseudarthrobacter sp. J64]|uniref:hypothetical protein n=1 Tax=Pseudarthrobacter sp. J64 TaxID=3116485 RepID=UPI002E8064F5|nr:hypothetical protein [Pseudarthrobacter sp. J64]MEE2567933.1 hypothetical protein [Pseudarthrobacter sp. J64]
MISMLLPLLSMPTVTQNFGAPGWSAIAIGMSVGSGGSVLIDFAWSLLGPQRVASTHASRRAGVLALATRMRAWVILAVAPLALAAVLVVPSEDRTTTLLVCSAFLAMGMSGNWFFIGCGRPNAIFLSDLIPRAAAVVLAVTAMELGAPLQVYGWLLASAAVVSVIAAHRLAGVTFDDLTGVTALRASIAFRRHKAAIAGRAISSLYISLPVTLVAFVAPTGVHAFAAADSLLKMVLNVLGSVINAFQRYVGSSAKVDLLTRLRLAVLVNAGFGAVAGLLIVVFGPFIFMLLMSGTLDIGIGMTLPLAGVVLTTCISRAVGSLGLVAMGRVSAITVSAVVGAVIGVPAIMLGAGLQGAELALTGMFVAEAAVLIVQVLALSRAIWKNPL